jgi:YhcH/YjgK/YiaL family protein
MIIDAFRNCDLYLDIHPGLKKGFDFLRNEDLASLPDGRHEIQGSNIYALLSSYKTESEEAKKLEAHRRYLDIQSLVSGNELIFWADIETLEPAGDYSEEKDIIFFKGSSPSALHLRPGYFAVFFTADAHKPGCSLQTHEPVRKALVKIAL